MDRYRDAVVQLQLLSTFGHHMTPQNRALLNLPLNVALYYFGLPHILGQKQDYASLTCRQIVVPKKCFENRHVCSKLV